MALGIGIVKFMDNEEAKFLMDLDWWHGKGIWANG